MTATNPTQPHLAGPAAGQLEAGERLSRFRREFGIYGNDGKSLPYSDISGDQLRTFPVAEPKLSEDAPLIDGPVLFGGLASQQFGHTILNSIGRLWALSLLPPETKIIFYPKRRALRRFYPHLPTMLDLLGIRNEFQIVTGPARFDTVYTATDLFGERFGGEGTDHFFHWIDRALPPSGPVDQNKALYVSRSGLGPEAGRFAGEDRLEEILAEDGYVVFRPEAHSLADQVAEYQSAGKLIFAEGSALHLMGLVVRPEQSVAVIKRRRDLPSLIERQLAARSGANLRIVDAITDVYWPPKRSDHFSVSLLDFQKLRADLAATGMIDASRPWPETSPDQMAQSLNAGLADGEKMLDLEGRKAFLQAFRAKRQP